MSIASMVRLGIQRQRELSAVQADAASGGQDPAGAQADPAAPATPANAQSAVTSALDKVTAFIPSEVIGIYVAGLGIIAPDTAEAKWMLFGICLLLIPVIMVLNYLIKKKAADSAPAFGTWLLLVLFALVAYVVWAAALPNTPFLAFSSKATVYAGFLVLILAAVMYKAADLFGVVPKSS